MIARRVPGGIVLDVSSIISAQEFIAASNERREPDDPFAAQSFVEVVQSLIFHENIFVPHPTLPFPAPSDFGPEPQFLQLLLRLGVVKPLTLVGELQQRVSDNDAFGLRILEKQGVEILLRFLQKTVDLDALTAPRDEATGVGSGRGIAPIRGAKATKVPLSQRIAGWSEFQRQHVRLPNHHLSRIRTVDGIEDDLYGTWARSAGNAMRGALAPMSGNDDPAQLVATLARSVRYRSWAGAVGACYQPHPVRRDFAMAFDLISEEVGSSDTDMVLDAIHGIRNALAKASGESDSARVQLFDMELPLLGGRLWAQDETGIATEGAWLDEISRRIAGYRARAADLRRAVGAATLVEDRLRLRRDLDEVSRALLVRLGFTASALSPLERDLVSGVESVTSTVGGLPKVGVAYVGVRDLSKRFGFRGSAFQKFVYLEFLKAWKRSGT